MAVTVRPMTLQETVLIIEYFHAATSEHLEILGVDPTRLPSASQWQRLYEQMFDHRVLVKLQYLTVNNRCYIFNVVLHQSFSFSEFCTEYKIDPKRQTTITTNETQTGI